MKDIKLQMQKSIEETLYYDLPDALFKYCNSANAIWLAFINSFDLRAK